MMEADAANGAFYLEQVTITDDAEDQYRYEEVSIADEGSAQDADEDLDFAVRSLQELSEDVQATVRRQDVGEKPPVARQLEAIDDFVRNFLFRMGMSRTLDCFQSEWYELQEKEQLGKAERGTVSDVYIQNQELHDKLTSLHRDLAKFQDATRQTQDTLVTLRKERDHHRMHHQRVLQEKNRLLNDLKRLQKHYASYEPALRSLREKYEAALKEKMLTKLERDRAVGQIAGLQATLHSLESGLEEPTPIIAGFHDATETGVEGPSQRRLREARQQGIAPADEPAKSSAVRHAKDSEFPVDTRVNPFLGQVQKQPSDAMRSGSLRISQTLKAHEMPVSSMALHPRKEILVTASDDQLWKMWSIPNGDIIMTGQGHTDWIGDCDFNPTGTNLATGGGDSTVKVWDFSQGACVLTLEGHGHAVWGCCWHSCGDFIASSSMDNSSKVWDVNSERCRQTLRGHTDSVNSVEFLPYSNTLLTSSADKTLSLWDARTGRCAQIFYGHLHSCNHGTFNLKGDTVASCDSYGVIKVWDVRKGTATMTLNLGPHPANRLSFHPSGYVMAVASDDGCVRIVDLLTGHVETLSGHEDAVQTVVFSPDGDTLFSGGSDGTIRMWE
ncbi:sperm-associated antigen 16 protein [Lethenteron reissneri]|uniref:sperm-associated antigen 16 protein n=1 Tax=Lethenteron reissneri TaxID=7753 RepID=UPI002AB6576F|nr:sperm-associated antigen 16 protein [Lethenteron reissneri]XP_061429019.1 sperm-associated antigen 16 protein [Lethenteron reissneri]